jgi:hypothetical protein
MTPEQLRMARHALGLPNERSTSYRNRYYVPIGTQAERDWDDLVTQGLAARAANRETQVMFGLTTAGAQYAIEPDEKLDREDFPNSSGKAMPR